MTISLAAGRIAPSARSPKTAYTPCEATWDVKLEEMLASSTGPKSRSGGGAAA
jgi:hypothetical protein